MSKLVFLIFFCLTFTTTCFSQVKFTTKANSDALLNILRWKIGSKKKPLSKIAISGCWNPSNISKIKVFDASNKSIKFKLAGQKLTLSKKNLKSSKFPLKLSMSFKESVKITSEAMQFLIQTTGLKSSKGKSILVTGPSCKTTSASTPNFLVTIDHEKTSGIVTSTFTPKANIVGVALNTIAKWEWDVGDGRILSGSSVAIKYSTPGIYPLTVVVTDKNGVTAQANSSITVFPNNGFASSDPLLPAVIGDVTGDGIISLEDSLKLAQMSTGLVPHLETFEGDLNLDSVINELDITLASLASLDSETLPSIILPESASEGALVTVISPKLVNPESEITIKVGGSATVQKPRRTVLGYAQFMIPLNLPPASGAVPVYIFENGVQVQELSFNLMPGIIVTSPEKDFEAIATKTLQAFNENKSLFLKNIAQGNLEANDKEQLSIFVESRFSKVIEQYTQFMSVIASSKNPELLTAVIKIFHANLSANSIVTSSLTKSYTYEQIQGYVDSLCDANLIASFMQNITQTITGVCYAAQAGALIGTFISGGVLAPVLASVAVSCNSIILILEPTNVVLGVVADVANIQLYVSAESDKATPNSKWLVKAKLGNIGTEVLCKSGAEQAITKLISHTAIKRILTIPAIDNLVGDTLKQWGNEASKVLEKFFGDVTQKIDKYSEAEVFKSIGVFFQRACEAMGAIGPDDVTVPLDKVLVLMPDNGSLVINSEGIGEFECKDSSKNPIQEFEVEMPLCEKEKSSDSTSVSCFGTPVLVTLGDNGSANDDIFELKIDGETVLSSDQPVRSINATLSLSSGQEYRVEMLGRAAPDGIGTYFITFPSNVTVLSGDPQSGLDLTPGVVKNFRILVN
jgi:PKD repeat protein